MIIFSTDHASNSTQEFQGMAQSSIETALRSNPDSEFHLFLIWRSEWFEQPEYVSRLKERFGDRFVCHSIVGDYSSKIALYSMRFSEELLCKLPRGRVAYVDLDLYHSKSFVEVVEGCADWSKFNICVDTLGYCNNKFVIDYTNRSGLVYLNTGLVAWDTSNVILQEVLKDVTSLSRSIKDADSAKYPYYDQDVFNQVVACRLTSVVHLLPEEVNHPPRLLGNAYDAVSVAQIEKTYGVRVFHIMSYQQQRHLFFDKMIQSEGWSLESLAYNYPKDGQDLKIVVISHNQAPSISKMKSYLDRYFPKCPVTLVLDRCTDNSVDQASLAGIPFITNWEGTGFLAGRMRDLGLSKSGACDTLFLDGDRIPSGGFNYAAAREALQSYDISMLPVADGEFRYWFSQDSLVPNPNYGKWNNDVFTCGIVMRKSAIAAIQGFQGGLLFVKDFDSQFGEEDRYLGDVAYHLGLTCAGFPKKYALSGGFRPNSDRGDIARNLDARRRLREGLTVMPEATVDPGGQKRLNIRDKIRSKQ